MFGTDFTPIIVALIVSVAVFFIFRGVLLWYWKVNTIVKNQERTNELLQQLVNSKESSVAPVVNGESPQEKQVQPCTIPDSYSPTDELVIVVNSTGEEKTWKMKEWDVAVKYGNEDRFTPIRFIKK